MSEQTLNNLTNPEFDFTFNGKTYRIRKATLRQVISYQQKIRELLENKSPATDFQLVAYCIYLILHDKDDTLTEDFILDNTRGDIDIVQTLETLGFMKPGQAKVAKIMLQESQEQENDK